MLRVGGPALVTLLLTTTVACGSTVQSPGVGGSGAPGLASSQSAPGDTALGGEGLGPPAAEGAAGGSGTEVPGSAQLPEAEGAGTTGRPGGESGSGAATGAGGPAAEGGGPTIGPGVSATEILIGRTRILNAAAANAAFGNSLESAPTDRYDKAMVDYVNSHGGAAGRKIQVDYYTIDASANKSQDQIEQEACARWTQDKRVYAVLTGSSDNLRSCLANKGIPQVFENVFSNSDDATFATFRSYYEINAINLSHLGNELPQQLAAGGYFASGAKVGLLTFDSNQHQRAVKQNLEPAMRRLGLSFAEKAYVKTPRTASEQSDALASLPGFVLQFKQAGVDHLVVFGDQGAALLVYFSKNAASQGYHPKYGITSSSGPQIVIDQGLMDPAELKGAVGAGWNPIGDVGSRPYTRFGSGYERCASIMAKAGIAFDGNDNNKVVGTKTCDAFFFLVAAVERGAPSITRDSFLTGAESLGDTFGSALTHRTSITPGARDGVAALSTIAFEEGCTCFRYRGDLRRIR